MKKEQKLRQIAQYLRKLPAKKFDFGTWMEQKKGCGTVCCAAGWIPKAFEKTPEVASEAAKVWFKPPGRRSHEFDEEQALKFMNFSKKLFDHCFIADWSNNGLWADASKEEVAEHLEKVARDIKNGEWRGHNYGTYGY